MNGYPVQEGERVAAWSQHAVSRHAASRHAASHHAASRHAASGHAASHRAAYSLSCVPHAAYSLSCVPHSAHGLSCVPHAAYSLSCVPHAAHGLSCVSHFQGQSSDWHVSAALLVACFPDLYRPPDLMSMCLSACLGGASCMSVLAQRACLHSCCALQYTGGKGKQASL